MGSAETVTANFVRRHTLTVARMKHAGYVTGGGINCGAGTGRSLCSVTLDHGTAVTLTATAHDHYRFSDWFSGCSGTSPTCSFVLNGDKSVKLRFWVLYTLTVSTSPSNGGYVTGSGISCGRGGRTDCDTEDKIDTEVRLTATAAAGHRFTGWSGCTPSATDGAGQCTATISGHRTVTANFVRRYTLNAAASPSGGGKVTGTVTKASGETTVIDCGTDCSEVVDANTTVKLAASPAAGHRFTGWSGACTGTGSCSVVVNGNKSVTANFAKQTYKLTVTKPSNGYVAWGSRINCGSGAGRTDCMETVQHGTSVSLASHPDTGYKFDDWSGKCDGQTTAACTFVMTAPATAGVTFTKQTYKLTVTKPSNGYVLGNGINCGSGSRTDCVENNVAHGTSVSLASHPDTGYKFKSWSGCPASGSSASTTTPCAFTMQKAETVGASFEKKKHLLTVTKSSKGYATWGSRINCGSGTGRTDCTERVAHDTPLSLAATPNAGYRLGNWTCLPNDSTCLPAKITSDLKVTPNFETTLAANAGGPYAATYVPPVIHTPFGTVTIREFFHQKVTATATGGVRLSRSPWYSFQWAGATAGVSTTYLFYSPGSYSKEVTVTDRLGETAKDTATINARRPGAGGASGESGVPFPVPLGGVLRFVWGGDGDVTAASGNAAVAAVSVDGGEIGVSGVSAGNTEIAIQTASGELQVPVQVGKGG